MKKYTNHLKVLSSSMIAISLAMAPMLSVANDDTENDNFKFALPDNYSVIEHKVHPRLNGGSVVFAPTNNLKADKELLRLQTYPLEYIPKDITSIGIDKPRETLNTILMAQLEENCINKTVDSGKIRHRNGGIRINWWTTCQLAATPEQYAYERGRMFLSKSGAYFISHINHSNKENHKFSRNEVKWFEHYLYNSSLCQTGKNCGEEGALINEMFVQK